MRPFFHFCSIGYPSGNRLAKKTIKSQPKLTLESEVDMNLKNKNVVITGGSSGLGRELARVFSEKCAQVAIIARGEEALLKTACEIYGVIPIVGDVSQKNAIYPLVGEIESKLGSVDILIHAASALGTTPLKLLMDTDCEDFESVLQTNLLGPFRLTKALGATMLLRDQGVVVNISSDAAISAYPKWGAYGVSKAALDHLTRIFAAELPTLKFLAIDPGDMRTPLHFAAVPNADPSQLRDPADSARAIVALLEFDNFEAIRRSL